MSGSQEPQDQGCQHHDRCEVCQVVAQKLVDENADLRAQVKKVEESMRVMRDMNNDLVTMLLKVVDEWWPYVHQWCTIESRRNLFFKARNLISKNG